MKCKKEFGKRLCHQKRLEENKTQFLQTLEDLKLLAQNDTQIETKDILSLIQNFSKKHTTTREKVIFTL